MGAAARPRHRTGDPHPVAGGAAGGAWLSLPGAAPAREAGMARLGMENVGGQSPRPLLPAYPEGQTATDGRAIQVETAGARRGPHHETGKGVRTCGAASFINQGPTPISRTNCK